MMSNYLHDVKFIKNVPHILIDGTWYPAIYGGAEPADDKDKGTDDDKKTEDKDKVAPLDAITIQRTVQVEITKHLSPIKEQMETLSGLEDRITEKFSSTLDKALESVKQSTSDDTDESDDIDDTDKTDDKDKQIKKSRGRKSQEVIALEKKTAEQAVALKRLEEQAEQARERDEELVWKSRYDTRDSRIRVSLEEHNAVSVEGGLKHFRDDMKWDVDTEDWVYEDKKSGASISIEAAIKENIPPYLVKAKIAGAGSGSHSPDGKEISANQGKVKDVDDVKKLLDLARASGNHTDRTRYVKAKKELIAAKVDVSALTATSS